MMNKGYPNLPLIQERFSNRIRSLLSEKQKEHGKNFFPQYMVDVFNQTFPNTAGIHDEGGMAGQAVTTQYVTVIRELNTNICGVFGGNSLAYILDNPAELFEFDVERRNIAVIANAPRRYNAEIIR